MLSTLQIILGLLLFLTPTTAHKPPSSKSSHANLHKKDIATPSPWHRLNNPILKHTGPNKSFTLTAPPATDIWRPNTTSDNFTAPYVYRICSTASFQRISVTINADWKTRYDQGGIAIVFPNGKKGVKGAKWIKTGIEFENGAPQLGTVGTYAFSDWSLSPVVPKGGKSARFVVERNTTELWVYNVVKNERYPLRELTWAFLEDRDKKNAEMWVGVYAAKPIYTEGTPSQNLSVEFKDLRIEC
ncbi:hypothetical protein Slin15195_G104610 [Septoria linicola]|uniref:Uncharacterized protein n=1 Tax=Septoria linicola TaxID=215465 RepID=A0A9Q9AWE5_9PEZI|nr:hypothetical protein Slin14017_G067650 [Septoria linicola]USW57142.1 hypothetical protein Slin15195_G104610 [Septoria linicola]